MSFPAISVLIPYLPVYMRQLRLSPVETATIVGVSKAVNGPVRAFVGVLADKTRRHVDIATLCCVVTGSVYALLYFVSSTSSSLTDVEVPYRRTEVGRYWNGDALEPPSDREGTNLTRAFTIWSSKENRFRQLIADLNMCYPPLSDYVGNVSSTADRDGDRGTPADAASTPRFRRTFWIVFAVYLVGQAFLGPILTIVDGLVSALLGRRRQRGLYGQQRLWGTVGHGVFSWLSGVLMDAFQTSDDEKNFAISFVAFVVLMLLSSVVVRRIEVVEPAEKPATSGSMATNVGRLFVDSRLTMIFVTMFIAGFLSGADDAFLFWFLRSLGASQQMLGAGLLVRSVPEIVVLFYSGRIVAKLGDGSCLCAVFVVYACRMFFYSTMVDVRWYPVIEPTHAITFGLLYPAIKARAGRIAPAGMDGTVNGFIDALYKRIGKHTSTLSMIRYTQNLTIAIIVQ